MGGRAAILLCLTAEYRADLYGLGEAIESEDALLYLRAHRLGRYGLLRAVLALPGDRLLFETPLTLADGDVQEFLAAAYETETVELHISHLTHDRLLPFTCNAAGIREVLDAALDMLSTLEHPTTPAEQASPVAELEARFPEVSDGLSRETLVRLKTTGLTESHVMVDVDL